MADSGDRRLTERLQFLVDVEMKRRVDKLPKGTEYAPILRACLSAWLDGQIQVDERGNVSVGEPKKPIVVATTETVHLVEAFAAAIAKPRDDAERALRILAIKVLNDRL